MLGEKKNSRNMKNNSRKNDGIRWTMTGNKNCCLNALQYLSNKLNKA